MATSHLTANIWRKIEPLLPPEYTETGMSNRQALDAMIYVLTENVGWLTLDRTKWEYHGSTVWRRLRRWQDLGYWEQVGSLLASELPGLDESAKERIRTGRRGTHSRYSLPRKKPKRST
jgi:transposase